MTTLTSIAKLKQMLGMGMVADLGFGLSALLMEHRKTRQLIATVASIKVAFT
jgi:uncharacterized membrane protein